MALLYAISLNYMAELSQDPFRLLYLNMSGIESRSRKMWFNLSDHPRAEETAAGN